MGECRGRDEGQTEGADILPGREVMRFNYGEVGELTNTTCGV